MRKSRFSEEQIIGLLKEAEAGRKVADVCREHGISEPTFYRWKSKYSGMEVGDAKKLARAGGREPTPEASGGGSAAGQPGAEGRVGEESGEAPRPTTLGALLRGCLRSESSEGLPLGGDQPFGDGLPADPAERRRAPRLGFSSSLETVPATATGAFMYCFGAKAGQATGSGRTGSTGRRSSRYAGGGASESRLRLGKHFPFRAGRTFDGRWTSCPTRSATVAPSAP